MNDNAADTTAQPMGRLVASSTFVAYSGVYTQGGANVALNRSYQLVPGFDAIRITQSFVNNGPAGILLRCFDSYDPDLLVGATSFFHMLTDRFTLSTNGMNIQMGAGIVTNVLMAVIQGTTEPGAVLAASTSFFGIHAGSELNSFFASSGADSDGALLDDSLDIARELNIPPGVSATFVFGESFGTNLLEAERFFISGALAQPYFLPDSIAQSGGQFRATLVGPAPSYQVLVSSNLTTWDVLTTVPMLGGSAQVVDPTTSGSPRFYRARQLP